MDIKLDFIIEMFFYCLFINSKIDRMKKMLMNTYSIDPINTTVMRKQNSREVKGRLLGNEDSGDLRDYVKWIQAGNVQAEKNFIPQFLEAATIMVKRNRHLAYVPCPAILAKRALSFFLLDIKKGTAGKTLNEEKLHAALVEHLMKNVDWAIDQHLKMIIHPYNKKHQQDSTWKEKMKEQVKKAYLPYIYYRIDQKDSPEWQLRIRDTDKLAEDSLKGLIKNLIQDIEEENKSRHYGYLIRKIVNDDIKSEIRIVNAKEPLPGDDSEEKRSLTPKKKRRFTPRDSKIEKNIAHTEMRYLLRHIIKNHLSPRQQYFIYQSYIEGKTYKEILEELLQQSGWITRNISHKIDMPFISKEIKKAREKILNVLNQMGIYALSDLY